LDGWRSPKNNYSSLSLKIVLVVVTKTVANMGRHEIMHVIGVYTGPALASCLLMEEEEEVTYTQTNIRTDSNGTADCSRSLIYSRTSSHVVLFATVEK
jgi:hypothetical protein